jgi:hypothetical protein
VGLRSGLKGALRLEGGLRTGRRVGPGAVGSGVESGLEGGGERDHEEHGGVLRERLGCGGVEGRGEEGARYQGAGWKAVPAVPRWHNEILDYLHEKRPPRFHFTAACWGRLLLQADL